VADEIWIDVLPSMRSFGSELVRGATRASRDAGQRAGREYAAAFEDTAEGASDAAVRELEGAEKRAAGLVSKLSGDVSKARQSQQTAAANLITAEQRLADTVEKYGESSAQAEAAALRLEAARGKASDANGRFHRAEEALKESQKAHTTVVEQLTEAQREAGDAVDEQPARLGRWGSALDSAKAQVSGFSGSLGGIVTKAAAAVGGLALLGEAAGQAIEGQDMGSKLTATLGATAEQSRTYGEVAGNLYADAYGDSLSDVGTAVDAVASSISGMRDASAADLEKVTSHAMNLEDAMGVGVAESATTAGAMIKNGLASDATEAFDMITSGMQQVPASLRGEILPVLDEYGKHFKGLGITGENAMSMIVAASQDGAIGMDKIGDALKEFTIRGTDLSKSTSAVFDQLGFNTEDMTNRLLAGGDSASSAMSEVVNALASVKDPGDQAAAAIALFGTPLEDLGTDQIPAFLAQIDPLAGSLSQIPSEMRDVITPAMEKYGDTMSLVGAEGKNAMGLIVLAGEQGAQSMDVVSGALSAFASNAADLTPEAEKAYKSIGLSGKSMTKGISAGGRQAEKAFAQIMAGLRGMEDPAEQAKAATALFGDGIKGIAEKDLPAFLAQIDPATASMAEIPSAMPDMSKYSAMFESFGIEGSTAMSLVAKASQDGAFDMDRVSGAFKAFSDRATTMSASTTSAYELMGLSSKDMTTALAAGGEGAKDALGQIVAGLQGIQDPSQRASAAVALFGDPVKDLSAEQLPAFLQQIDPMAAALDSTAGAAAAMGESLKSGPSTSLESLKRSFVGMVSEGIQPFLGPADAVLRWVKDTPGVLTGLGFALGAIATAWGVFTVAQWAANSAMLASPITWIVLGVVAAVGLVVLAVTHWGEIMTWLKESILDPVFGWIGAAWETVTGAIKSGYEASVKWVVDAWGTAMTWLKDSVLDPVFGWVDSTWRSLTGGIKVAYDASVKWTVDAWGTAMTWLKDSVLDPVFGWVDSTWRSLTGGIKAAYDASVKWTVDAWGTAMTWLKDSVLDPVFGWISSKWDALTSGIASIWDKTGRPLFEGIQKLLTGDFVGAFEKAKEAVEGVWRSIGNVVRAPINFVIGTVYNKGLKSLFNGIAEKLGLGWRLPDVDELPAFAKGGVAQPGWALVGEEGPELVNFSSPGRVYTASETQAMLGGREQAPEGALSVLAGPSKAQSTGLPVGGFWSDVWKGIEGGAKAAAGWVRGRIGDGLRALAEPIKGTLKSLLPGAGINELIRDSGISLIDSMIKKVAGADDKQQAAAEAAAAATGGGSTAVYEGALGAFHRPSKGPFTSMYGPRWGSFHAGVDIAGGGPTYAALPGTVQKVGWNAVQGRTGIGIVLNHGPGLWTYYGHNPSLGAVQVRPGDTVKGGQHIGQQGATGNVTGTHLHFEVHKGRVGASVNPMQYLKYDTGGVLQPGLTPTLNLTGRPEYIFTQPQWSILSTLVERGAEQSKGGGDTTINVGDESTARELVRLLEHRALVNSRR
jgi:phage-related minor tail protein